MEGDRGMPRVALVQDHLAQMGGAERVALSLVEGLGLDGLHTSVYAPHRTYPGFADIEVRDSFFSRFPLIRHDHRFAFPLMPLGFYLIRPQAEVVLAASAGWSHGARAGGRKVVYWYAPPRWLYQQNQYLAGSGWVSRAVRASAPLLRVWDRRAVGTVDRHLAVSSDVASRLRRHYDVEAEVVHPPMTLCGRPRPLPEVAPGFLLVVSRLLSYKNIHHVVDAMRHLPDQRLVVVGTGPFETELGRRAPANVRFLGVVPDDELCWLYDNCALLVAAAYEDFGLTPVEAASFGRPTVAFRAGGYLDTVCEGVTGHFFDALSAAEITSAIQTALGRSWDAGVLQAHAARFSPDTFARRIRAIIDEEGARTGPRCP